jgi:hypothetical protein
MKQPHALRCCDNYEEKDLYKAKPVCKFFSMEVVESPIYTMKHPHCKGKQMPYETPAVTAKVGCASHSSTTSEKRVLETLKEIIDLVDGRYEGMKRFYETPPDQRTGTDREAKLMFEEVKIIKDCVDSILEQYGLNSMV